MNLLIVIIKVRWWLVWSESFTSLLDLLVLGFVDLNILLYWRWLLVGGLLSSLNIFSSLLLLILLSLRCWSHTLLALPISNNLLIVGHVLVLHLILDT